MDQLEPIIFEGFKPYVIKRYRPKKGAQILDDQINALVALEKEFFPESAYLAELGYSKINDYELIKRYFGELLSISLTEREVELGANFKSIARQAMEGKGNRLQAKVDAVMRGRQSTNAQ